MPCQQTATCVFYKAVEPSIVKRMKYVGVYSYCRGGQHEECAIYRAVRSGVPVAHNLLPDGSIGDYADDAVSSQKHSFLIIEDSPIFAAITSSTISSHFPGARIVRKTSFATALEDLANDHAAIVCGFGLGGEHTAHDVRRHTKSPIVVLTGRPDHIELPHGARRVNKGDGPEALASAIKSCLA